MEPEPTLPTPSVDELSLAMTLFQKSLSARFLDALQPVAPQAVFTTWITVWMLIYQRLHANATLAMAVGQFLEAMGSLSSNKRVRDHSLSANMGNDQNGKYTPRCLSATAAIDKSLGLNQAFWRIQVRNFSRACSGVIAKPITNSGDWRPVSTRVNSAT